MAFYDRERLLNVYGNAVSMEKVQVDITEHGENQEEMNRFLSLHTLQPFVETRVGDYRITPLAANHDKRETCFLYVIERGEAVLLYGHDSAMFKEETWEAMKKYRFSCVVLDCTMVERTGIFEGHMGLPENIKIRERMLAEGMAGGDTKFVSTHFVHTFNPVHERITPIFAKEGLIAAYDGMELTF